METFGAVRGVFQWADGVCVSIEREGFDPCVPIAHGRGLGIDHPENTNGSQN